jgi:hypothetical protein
MAAPGYQEGDLFICLEPTSDDEARRWGGRYKYQQVVIGYIIEEFGFDQEAIVPIPSLARHQINSQNLPYSRRHPPSSMNSSPGEVLTLGHCIHLGYETDFLIIRGVHQHSTFDRRYRHKWQQSSLAVINFVDNIKAAHKDSSQNTTTQHR